MFKLISDDGATFDVSENALVKLNTLKIMKESEVDTENGIPVNGIDNCTLKNILRYIDIDLNNSEPEEKKEDNILKYVFCSSEEDFFNELSQENLFKIIQGANFLDYPRLLNASCQVVADMIKGKTPQEIRKTFNIKNDFTPEEEEQIRKENEWLEEK